MTIVLTILGHITAYRPVAGRGSVVESDFERFLSDFLSDFERFLSDFEHFERLTKVDKGAGR